MRKLILFLLPLIIAFNAYSQSQNLSKKELRKERREMRNASYHFTLLNHTPNDSLKFQDHNIEIAFTFDFYLGDISFKLKNRLDKPISILWGSTSFIDQNGNAMKVINKATTKIYQIQNISNTIIPPGATWSDVIRPLVKVMDQTTYQSVKNIFKRRDKIENNGKTFSIFMPIQLPSGTKNYDFKFKIEVY